MKLVFRQAVTLPLWPPQHILPMLHHKERENLFFFYFKLDWFSHLEFRSVHLLNKFLYRWYGTLILLTPDLTYAHIIYYIFYIFDGTIFLHLELNSVLACPLRPATCWHRCDSFLSENRDQVSWRTIVSSALRASAACSGGSNDMFVLYSLLWCGS